MQLLKELARIIKFEDEYYLYHVVDHINYPNRIVAFQIAVSRLAQDPVLFYFDNPENNQYYVKVSYAAAEADPDHSSIIGAYNITLKSQAQIVCNFFNYDREHYYLIINGVPYYDINIYTITISASDPATWGS